MLVSSPTIFYFICSPTELKCYVAAKFSGVLGRIPGPYSFAKSMSVPDSSNFD